jgi:hypothetical protein
MEPTTQTDLRGMVLALSHLQSLETTLLGIAKGGVSLNKENGKQRFWADMALTLRGQVTPLFVKGATEPATVGASLLVCLYLGTQVAFKDCHAPVLAMEKGGGQPRGASPA